MVARRLAGAWSPQERRNVEIVGRVHDQSSRGVCTLRIRKNVERCLFAALGHLEDRSASGALAEIDLGRPIKIARRVHDQSSARFFPVGATTPTPGRAAPPP